MSAASGLQYLYLAYFARPQADRRLYRLIKHHKIGRIFEIGVGDLDRTVRILRVARRYATGGTVKYACVDPFDTRPDGVPALPLIAAHRALGQTQAAVRLVPGPPEVSLPEVANAHLHTDLILVAPWITEQSLGRAWFYLPRMLHDSTLILWERTAADGKRGYRQLTAEEVQQQAKRVPVRKAA